MTREAAIDAIVNASRKPDPEIVPCTQLLATDGNWYSALGFPLGVSAVQPYELRTIGYALRGRDGCTYGTRRATAAEVLEHWTRNQDSDAADFRRHLETECDNARLIEKADYWLKVDLTIAELGAADADAAFARHQAEDPHCTCNDCMRVFAENLIP